ncbi:uncharacterized protein LOC124328197 [Daphnia pulicaria]|uniref:uncharacterized protein LOC124328197 n=1 Tax=Daphnia pulicaria TaxID=35523 RepID=UPI001EEC9991|nr:uncharacterized protein LOC124328197 [Daphnia pulicaria]
MSTRVLAAPVSLDVRMMLPSYSRLGGGGGRPRIVPSTGCLSRVKRCLFGLPSSPEEALQQAADELQRQTESDSKRWNFDFVRDEPLNGPLDWQPAEPHSNRMETITTADPVSPSSSLRQSQITEFLQPRKRTSSGALSSINNKRLRMQTTSSPQARRT